jgi:peroxiredoxin
MATFKMIGNDDSNRYAIVVEEGDIKSFQNNPEWEEVVVVEVKEEVKKKSKSKEE